MSRSRNLLLVCSVLLATPPLSSPTYRAQPPLLFARDHGHVYTVGGVWDRLGLSQALVDAGVRGDSSFDAASLIRPAGGEPHLRSLQ